MSNENRQHALFLIDLMIFGTGTICLMLFVNPMAGHPRIDHEPLGNEIVNTTISATNTQLYSDSPRISIPVVEGGIFCVVAKTPSRGIHDARIVYEYDQVVTRTITDRFGSYEINETKHHEYLLGTTGDHNIVSMAITIPENVTSANIVVYTPHSGEDGFVSTKVDVVISGMSALELAEHDFWRVASLGRAVAC